MKDKKMKKAEQLREEMLKAGKDHLRHPRQNAGASFSGTGMMDQLLVGLVTGMAGMMARGEEMEEIPIIGTISVDPETGVSMDLYSPYLPDEQDAPEKQEEKPVQDDEENHSEPAGPEEDPVKAEELFPEKEFAEMYRDMQMIRGLLMSACEIGLHLDSSDRERVKSVGAVMAFYLKTAEDTVTKWEKYKKIRN